MSIEPTVNEPVQQGQPVLSKNAYLFTLLLAASCFAALACSCPWGFVNEHLAHNVTVLIFFGLASSIITSLAAWGMFRDSDPYKRYAGPLALLTVLPSVSWFGTWYNSNDYTSSSVKEIATAFLMASLFFYGVRRFLGWRIGPSFTGDRRLRLSHIFLWTAVAGFIFAVLGWFRPSLDEFLFSRRDTPKLLSNLFASFAACWLALAGIGVALEGVRKIRYWVILAIVVLLLMSPMIYYHIKNGFPSGSIATESQFLLLPLMMFVFPWWCFGIYRSFGYSLIQDPPSDLERRPSVWKVAAVVGCLLLAAFAYGGNMAFAKQRNRKALQAKWLPLGIAAFSSDGKAFDRVYFDAKRPLTEETLAKIEAEKLKSVTIWGHVPDRDCLRKIVSSESIECVILRGGTITGGQLEELYDAQHLKEVYVECKLPITHSDVQNLRLALPDCEIIKE